MRFTAMNRMKLMTTMTTIKLTNPMQSSASLRATRMTAWAGMATLAVLAMASTGCYRHVVGTSGAGADNYDVQEPNIEKGESVWSEPKPTEKVPNRYTGTVLQKNTRPAPQPLPTKPPPQ
jgi:type IV secretory pathway VirB10-like protein